MIIKINDFSPIPYKLRLRIVQRYCELYETSKVSNDPWILHGTFDIKETGKYPVKVDVGSSNYHVKCRKTKTTYVFDIWFAV
jgi:hypothetical protein